MGWNATVTTKQCPYCCEDIHSEAIKCKHCGTWLDRPADPHAARGVFGHLLDDGFGTPRRLTRSATDVYLFGVLGGLGRYLGVDPTLLRIAYVVGTFFTALVPGFLIYLALAFLIPSEPHGKA